MVQYHHIRWRSGLPGRGVGLVAVVLAAAGAARTAAHPVSISQVSAYVHRDRIRLAVDLFLEDLFLFHNLKPSAEGRLPKSEIVRGIEAHKDFLLGRIQVLDAEGQALRGKVVGVRSFAIPDNGVPLGDLMGYNLTYTFEYALSEPPRYLTFLQELVDPALGIPVEMTLRVKQAGVEGDRVWPLAVGKPQVVDFDWDHPPPAADASEAEWKAWMKRREETTLGITSYSSLYVFLYIEDGEVRLEILVPLLTLEDSVLIPRDDDRQLDLAEQSASREQIEAFFTSVNPMTIDGRPASPEVARIDFYGLNITDFARRAEPRPVPIASARVGVILRYPVKRPPDTVQLTWDFFNQYVTTARALIYSSEGVSQATFDAADPRTCVYHWKRRRPWRPPRILPVRASSAVAAPSPVSRWMRRGLFLAAAGAILALAGWALGPRFHIAALVGSGVLVAGVILELAAWSVRPATPTGNASRAVRIFEQLHRNLYQAFRHRQEEPLYEALALSVDGPLLRDLYLQTRKSLVMQEQGGAVSRIDRVRLQKTHVLDLEPRHVALEAVWEVEGSVEHWGHVHSRTNRYQARFEIAPREALWKITSFQLLEEKQTRITSRLRGLRNPSTKKPAQSSSQSSSS